MRKQALLKHMQCCTGDHTMSATVTLPYITSEGFLVSGYIYTSTGKNKKAYTTCIDLANYLGR